MSSSRESKCSLKSRLGLSVAVKVNALNTDLCPTTMVWGWGLTDGAGHIVFVADLVGIRVGVGVGVASLVCTLFLEWMDGWIYGF